MNGTLRVVACLTNHPCLNCGVSASGTGLVLSGTSGIANGQFYVLGSTNLATATKGVSPGYWLIMIDLQSAVC